MRIPIGFGRRTKSPCDAEFAYSRARPIERLDDAEPEETFEYSRARAKVDTVTRETGGADATVRRAGVGFGRGSETGTDRKGAAGDAVGPRPRGMAGGPRDSVTDRVLRQLREGRTVRAIAATSGVSEVFVSTMLDHFGRLGMLDEASSLCSSGLGACSTTDLTDEARVACAGCPLKI